MTSHSQIAHMWAQQNKPSGKAPRMFFEGATLYSYGYHYALGVISHGVAILNADSYSSSTGKHQSHTRRAVSHMTQVRTNTATLKALSECESNKDYPETLKRCKASVLEHAAAYASAQIDDAAEIAASTRRKPETRADAISRAKGIYSDQCAILTLYKMKMPAATVKKMALLETDAAAIQSHNAAALKRADNARKKKQAAALPAWYAGTETYEQRGHLRYSGNAALRVKDTREGAKIVETSHGAEFPLDHGLRALPIIRAIVASGEVWQRNGKTIHLGHYQIDRIEGGQIVAGCHTIPVAEVERLAKSLGV